MSTEELESRLDELLSKSPTISNAERILHLQDLDNTIANTDVNGLEEKIYHVLKHYLHNKHPDNQKCALNLLNTCIEKKVLKNLQNALRVQLAYEVVFLCNNYTDETLEKQEIWLKAFNIIDSMADVFPDLCKNRSLYLMNIFQKAIRCHFTTSVQKLKALKMFESFISLANINHIEETIYKFCWELLLPELFNKNNENLQSTGLQILHKLLPHLQSELQKKPGLWDTLFLDIRNKYVAIIYKLLSEDNCLYANLWIFLIKLIGTRFHKGSPVVNSLLSCIESAFKTQNLEIRKHAFLCWQALIEDFAIDPNETYTEKRIKLLTIPLKTSNGKTEELVRVKIDTWCKLLEILNKNKIISSFNVLDAFLNFCFGPFCNTPLVYQLVYNKEGMQGLVSQGKKYSSLHLITCKAFLQLLGNPKYIDEELQIKLNVLKITGPIITVETFLKFPKNIIHSVGECCVLLSQLENSDRFECTAVNEALWKSLFHIVDTIIDEEIKLNIIQDIAAVILALISVARKKANLINFGLKSLFNIITSGEFQFFKNEKVSELLFIPMMTTVMKKDKALLQHDIILIFKKIFMFKRKDEKYLEFIQISNSLLLRDNNMNPEKVAMLQNIWFLLEDELENHLQNISKDDINEQLYLSVFDEFLTWPIAKLVRMKNTENITTKWKDLYVMFGKTNDLLQNKLGCLLSKHIPELIEQYPTETKVTEFVYFIVYNLKLDACNEETCENICSIYDDIKRVLSLKNLSNEVINIYETCVSHILDANSNLPYLKRLIEPINSCIKNLLDKHNKIAILQPALKFVEKINATDEKTKVLVDNLKEMLSKHKERTEMKISSTTVDKEIDKSEKEQGLILLGHDLNTMTPVKLKGSILKTLDKKESPSCNISPSEKPKTSNSEMIYVNSEYKFDPKKLTKQQREKLSRRRDDIPALYQDLSQSQTRDFNSSNSESLSEHFTQETETKEDNNKTENLYLENNELENNSEDNIYSQDTETNSDSIIKKVRRRRTKNETILEQNSSLPQKQGRNRKKKSLGMQPEITEETEKQNETVVEKIPLNLKENLNISIDASEPVAKKQKKSQNKLHDYNFEIIKKPTETLNTSEILSTSNLEQSFEETLTQDSLLKLEQNNEINKLENVPLALRVPSKINRGSRRVSTGTVFKNKELENTTDSNTFMDDYLITDDEKKKLKIQRELNRIKMDINHSDEYLKRDEKRKTRMSLPQQLIDDEEDLSDVAESTVPPLIIKRIKIKPIPNKDEASSTSNNDSNDNITSLVTIENCDMKKQNPITDSNIKCMETPKTKEQSTLKININKVPEGSKNKTVDSSKNKLVEISKTPKSVDASKSNKVLEKSKSADTAKSKSVDTPKSKSVEAPKTKSVETPKTKSVETPKTKSVETPKTKSVETPKTKSVETPKSKSVETFKTKSVETPKTKSVETSKTKSFETPKTKSVETSKTKSVETPKSKSVETPKTKSVETPKSKSVETPKTRSVETPKSKSIETPKSKFVETSESNKSINSPKNNKSTVSPKTKSDTPKQKTPKQKSQESPKTKLNETPKIKIKGTPKTSKPNKSSKEKTISRKRIKQEENVDLDSDFIESSQESEQELNLKQCKLPVLYPLESIKPGEQMVIETADSTIDLVKGPKATSPFKVSVKVPNSTKTANCKKINFQKNENTSENSNIEQMPVLILDNTVNEELIKDKLSSQDTEICTETQSLDPQKLEINDEIENFVENRKVILDNSLATEEETNDILLTPKKAQKDNDIPTSPISIETPTRNTELLRDTSEISPIKNVPKNNINNDVNQENVEKVIENESIVLFDSEAASSSSQNQEETEKLSGNSSNYNKVVIRRKSKALGGRSARMMKMIYAKETVVSSPAVRKLKTNKIESYVSPSSNRTKKMMNNLEISECVQEPDLLFNIDESDIINQEDVLCCGVKELPSPFATPGGSILKRKRNLTEENCEETTVQLCKKRRVNFSDPPVSSLKFIEKTVKSNFITTRSSTINESKSSKVGTDSLDFTEEETLSTLHELVENEDDLESNYPNYYDNTLAINENLINCQEPIAKILPKLIKSIDFVEPTATVLQKKNIETIGDLATLTELKVHQIPLKVETTKMVLNEYHNNLTSPVKAKRKIKPVELNSDENKVSVITKNNENIAEFISPPESDSVESNSEESNHIESQSLVALPCKNIEPIAVASSSNVVSSESENTSVLNRVIVKSEVTDQQYIYLSPTKDKDTILAEEYCGIKIEKFIQFLKEVIVKKQYDPKPLITALFSNNRFLTEMNCWENIIKYIVRDIGIWSLTKHLCSMKNIPALMIESILKNSLNEIGNDFICERLNKNEIIKFCSNECNLIQILKEYNSQKVYSAFFDLANDKQYVHLKYREMLQELYSCIIQPQLEISQILYNLEVVEIGNSIIKRMSDPKDMEIFLSKIYESVPSEIYFKPVSSDKIPAVEEKHKENEKTSDLIKDIVTKIDNSIFSKEEELLLLKSIAKKLNALEFLSTMMNITRQD